MAKRWTIWGRSADGMPKFPWGRPAPGFFTTGPAGNTSFVGLNPRGDSWVTDWTRRCLGVPTAEARALLAPVIDLLSDGAAGARDVLAKHKPAMTKDAYLELLRGLAVDQTFRDS